MFQLNKILKKLHPCEKLYSRRTRSLRARYNFHGSGKTVVGCSYGVGPREGECYFIHTILLHNTGLEMLAQMETVYAEESSVYREAFEKLRRLTKTRNREERFKADSYPSDSHLPNCLH